MVTMQRFQQEGIKTYEQAAKNLQSLKIAPTFDTPKHHVTVIGKYMWAKDLKRILIETADESVGVTDCAIIVLPADSAAVEGAFKDQQLVSAAKQLVVVINKM